MEKEMQSEVQTDEKKSSEVSGDKVENLMQETAKQLNEIKTSLQDKTTEVEELHAIALEQEAKFQEEIAKKESAIKELQEALDAATKDKEEAVNELNRLKEEALLNGRLRLLHDRKLLRSGEEAQIKQAEKVKSMSEEVFAEYVEDLLDIQTQVSTTVSEQSAEPAKEITPETEVEVLAEATINQVSDEQAKAKLREILTNLGKESVKETENKSEVNSAKENKEVSGQKETVSNIPEISLLQKAFLGILNLKNIDKEGK